MCQLLGIRLLGQPDFLPHAITKHSYAKEPSEFSLIGHFVPGHEPGSKLLGAIDIFRTKGNCHIVNVKEDDEPVIAENAWLLGRLREAK
jgi:hypothetical protein